MPAPDRPHILIGSTRVSFAHRDIRQSGDGERHLMEMMVHDEQAMLGPDQRLVEVVIETDYLGPGCRCTATVDATRNGDPTAPPEPAS